MNHVNGYSDNDMPANPVITDETNDQPDLFETIKKKLDGQSVTSGILHFSPFSHTKMGRLDGDIHFDALYQEEWEQCYFDLFNGRLEESALTDFYAIARLKERAAAYHLQGLTPIVLANLLHHYPGDPFINELSAAIAENRPVDMPDDLAEQFHERRGFFATALLRDRYEICTPLPAQHWGLHASFVFDPALYITNDPEPVQSLMIRFPHEDRDRSFAPGETITVDFDSAGDKQIQLTVHYPTKTLKTNFIIRVKDTSTIPTYDTWWPITATIPYKDVCSAGTAFVLYGNNNGVKHTVITKPILIADGFPGHTYEEMVDALTTEGFLGSVLQGGYDVILLTYANGSTYIQRNAFMAIACIQKIIEVRKSSEKLIVGGASMGGIITRYALAYMERHAMDHQARMYLSFDSPHQGANIPLGVQGMIGYLKSFNNEAAKFYTLLHSAAAQQFLIYQDPSNQLFRDFYTELIQLGFPSKVDASIGISNGCGNGQQMIPDHAHLIDFYGSLVAAGGDVWALPNLKREKVAYWRYGLTTHTYSVEGAINYDGAPGGLKSSSGDLAMALNASGNGTAYHWYDNSCFIPTVSSLNIQPWSASPYQQVPAKNAHTTFTKYFLSTVNSFHVTITPEINLFLLTQLGIAQYAGAVTVTFWEQNNYFHVFGISSKGDLIHVWWLNNRYYYENLGGTSLGGGLMSAPGAITAIFRPENSNIDIFVRSVNGNLLYTWYNAGGWKGWSDLGVLPDPGDSIGYNLAAVYRKDIQVTDVFSVSTNKHLIHACRSGEQWLEWQDLGPIDVHGGLAGNLSVIYREDSRILDVFAVAADGCLMQYSYNYTEWIPWNEVGFCPLESGLSIAPGNLTVMYRTENRGIYIFGISNNGAVVQKSFVGSWLAWNSLGTSNLEGGIAGGITAITGQNPIDIFAISNTGHLLHKCFSRQWWDWQDLSVGKVATAALPEETVELMLNE